ncbi:MAG: Gfo/Idh/MocA family protein [Armatimonadota bacterium]
MAGNQVRVGFVGCGVHARETLLPVVQRAGMELAAICDLDKRLAQRVTRRFGAFRAYQDIGAMVDEMDLDAVLACGPPELHAEAAEAALRGGCHVWTEMPAAPTSAEAERIAELAAERELVAAAGLVMRCAPAYQRLRDLCADEQFGPVRSIEVAWWPPRMHAHDEPLLFDLPHALDIAWWIGGDVRTLAVSRADDDDVLLVTMQLRSGAVAAVSFAAPADCPRERVTVASLRATATAEGRQTVTLTRCGRDETSVWGGRSLATAADRPERARGFLPQMEQFAGAVGGESEPTATIGDAAYVLRLAERARDSAGEAVEI